MNSHLKKALYHLTGLLRTRVIVCMVGIFVVQNKPSTGQWIVSLCGMAIGVSAIEAMRGGHHGPRDERKDS